MIMVINGEAIEYHDRGWSDGDIKGKVESLLAIYYAPCHYFLWALLAFYNHVIFQIL